MGIDAGNLLKIVETLKSNFKDIPIILIADNDRKQELKGLSNIGVESAKVLSSLDCKYF